MDTTRTPGIWQRSVAGFVFASLFTLSDGDASAQNTPAETAGVAPSGQTDSVLDDLDLDDGLEDVVNGNEKKQPKPPKVITNLVRGTQVDARNDATSKKTKKSKSDVRSTPDSVPGEAPIAKKKIRKSLSRDVGLADDLFDENTVGPRVKRTRTGTRASRPELREVMDASPIKLPLMSIGRPPIIARIVQKLGRPAT